MVPAPAYMTSPIILLKQNDTNLMTAAAGSSTVSMMRHLIRRAFELPPHIAAGKAVRLVGRAVRERVRRVEDHLKPTYSAGIGPLLPLPLALDCTTIDQAHRDMLLACGEMYMAHRFDILGSGWVDVSYGAKAEGIEGVQYALDTEALRVAETGDPMLQLVRANRAVARRIFGLIDSQDYRPIDWQRDMRSGYRWSAATPWGALRIGLDRGADIKMPWELGRMQHLSQLALLAALAAAGEQRARPAAMYVVEIRNQMLDFIASNPPRYGACWGCPMDVGIRVANWVLTLGLLEGAGFTLDEPCRTALACSVYDHASHIAANLEWSSTGRSNHYLADLVGLLFATAVLPRSAQACSWANFAARELIFEISGQFHPDGGNYEGSTGYHRLSGELAVFGLALTTRLANDEPTLFTSFDRTAMAGMRAPLPALDVPIDALMCRLGARIRAMLAFCAAIRRPDGRMIQIGDMDSGRLFRLQPTAAPCATATATPGEDQLRIDDLIAAIEALLGRRPEGHGRLAGDIVRALTGGGASLDDVPGPSVPIELPAESFDDIEGYIATLPVAARRRHRFPLPVQAEGNKRTVQLSAFPDFGLYVLRGSGFHLAFRCAPHDRCDAPTGHIHDDNLAIELFVGTDSVVSDPGTYVYTSLPEWRDAYRGADAHFVPRAEEWEAVAYGNYLFELRQLAKARCLHASTSGFAGVLEAPGGRVYRLVRIERDAVTVLDAADGGKLRPLAAPVAQCDGYGRKTSRPAFVAGSAATPTDSVGMRT